MAVLSAERLKFFFGMDKILFGIKGWCNSLKNCLGYQWKWPKYDHKLKGFFRGRGCLTVGLECHISISCPSLLIADLFPELPWAALLQWPHLLWFLEMNERRSCPLATQGQIQPSRKSLCSFAESGVQGYCAQQIPRSISQLPPLKTSFRFRSLTVQPFEISAWQKKQRFEEIEPSGENWNINVDKAAFHGKISEGCYTWGVRLPACLKSAVSFIYGGSGMTQAVLNLWLVAYQPFKVTTDSPKASYYNLVWKV